MNVLIGCEFSGVVRDAFTAAGHNAWSCDLIDSETKGKHIKGDLLSVIAGEDVVCGDGKTRSFGRWDMLIAFPPCTHLAVSGARWFEEKRKDGRQQSAINFFLDLLNNEIDRVAIENPVGIMSRYYRKPDQIIQPWQFGHGETKATCLWLENLPPLRPTKLVAGREARIHKMPPGPDRAKERSRTYSGIARAMAAQWGDL